MKTFTLSLGLLITFFLNNGTAQEAISVERSVISVPYGNAPAYRVFIPQAVQPKVIKEWSKLVIDETGRKGRKKPVATKSEYAIDSVYIRHIGEEPFNVMSSFMQKENGVEMMAALFYNGHYIDSADQALDEKASFYIRNFAIEQYRDAVKQELQIEQNKLEQLNGRLAQLIKENTKYKRNIASYNNDTVDLKQDIVLQNKLKEGKNQEILQQEMNVSRAKGDPINYKEQKKILSALKKENKQISNRIKKNDREIVSIVSEIVSTRRLIQLNDQEQDKQRLIIENQMALLEQIRKKYENIR